MTSPATVRLSMQDVLDEAMQAVGQEIRRMRDAGRLDWREGQQLAGYIQAAIALERNHREALKSPAEECTEDELLEIVAKEINIPASALRAMVAEFKTRHAS